MSEYSFRSYLFEFLRSVFVAIVLSLLFVLVSAMIFRFGGIDPSFVGIFNAVIKSVSVLAAAFLCFRLPQRGWLRGVAVGAAFAVISNVIYALTSGTNLFDLGLLADLLLCSVSGAVGGILAVNIKKPLAA